MALTRVIPQEQLADVERWELPEMGFRPPEPVVEEVPIEVIQPFTAEELEAIQQEAYQEGFEQGRREGIANGEQEIRKLVTHLESLAGLLAAPLQTLSEEVELELVQMVITLARQVLHRELASDNEQILAVVHGAMPLLPSNARRVKIFVNPQDLAAVRSLLQRRDADESPQWRLIEEKGISRGGCRIESEHSRIDATVEQRWQQVVDEILGDTAAEEDEDGAPPAA
jgi:flagellar assembly protein FliH